MEYRLALLILVIVELAYSQERPPDVRIASQCFKSPGIPTVRFGCGYDKMITILKAFHGIPENRPDPLSYRNNPDGPQCVPNEGHVSTNCSYCQPDCFDDSMNLVYDWSTCMGNSSCERTVMQSYIPSCKGDEKFSHYLQVHYQCVPKSDVINVCSNIDKWVDSGYIMSPGYPNDYPPNRDCLCNIESDWNTRIQLSFYDLLLQTKNGRCKGDWMQLRQGDQKHRHCGAIMTGIKNTTSEGPNIGVQFHSDSNNNKTQNFQYFTRRLKGFWLRFAPHDNERSRLHVTCRILTENDREVQEIAEDDAEFDENISADDIDVTTDHDDDVDDGDEIDDDSDDDINAIGADDNRTGGNKAGGTRGGNRGGQGGKGGNGKDTGGNVVKPNREGEVKQLKNSSPPHIAFSTASFITTLSAAALYSFIL